MRNLAVVAHPDDEILFMGGTLHKLCCDGEYCKIVCITHDKEHGRDPQFVEVCKMLGADHVQLNLEMGWKPHVPSWDMVWLRTKLGAIYHERPWDRIFTHNAQGEYGHPQHVKVHEAMSIFSCEKRYFCIEPTGEIRVELQQPDRDWKIKAAGVYARKTKALMAYPFFDREIETFTKGM